MTTESAIAVKEQKQFGTTFDLSNKNNPINNNNSNSVNEAAFWQSLIIDKCLYIYVGDSVTACDESTSVDTKRTRPNSPYTGNKERFFYPPQ